jgi:hypothetical protein
MIGFPEAGISAVAMNPTIAPHQIAATRSNQTRALREPVCKFPCYYRLAQKFSLSAVGNMTDLPVKASCVVSAQTISGHWPNGRR